MINLTREQLYVWVWTSPVTKVATELGISGSALAKKCRLNGIPTPGRGYWRQIEQGKKIERLLLPHQGAGTTSFLGEVTEGRAGLLDELVLAMAGAASDSGASVNANPLSPGTDTHPDGNDFRIESTSDFSAQVPVVAKVSVSQSSRLSVQQKNLLEPSDVFAAAAQMEMSESAQRFIVALSAAGQECDSPTRAVITLWVKSAMGEISQSSPIDRVIKGCQEVAAGTANPDWFASILKKSKAT